MVDIAGERNNFFELVLSGPLLYQYEDVIHRPEHRVPGVTDNDLYALIESLLVPAGEFATTNFSYRPLLKDAGDELVLEAAINGHADYIVTFNCRHFLPARRYGIQVIRPGEFLKMLGEKGFVYGKE